MNNLINPTDIFLIRMRASQVSFAQPDFDSGSLFKKSQRSIIKALDFFKKANYIQINITL